MPSNVLVIDDHPIVIAGCRATFEDYDEIEISWASSALDGLVQYKEHTPDVVVIDINLPDGSGFDLAQDIMSENPEANIVIISTSDAAALVVKAMDAGAKGYVCKMGEADDFRDAILTVNKGEFWFPSDVVQQMALHVAMPSEPSLRLSTREIKVLHAIASGSKLHDIAKTLDASYAAIATDCASLRSKLSARTNLELVRLAVEQKLI